MLYLYVANALKLSYDTYTQTIVIKGDAMLNVTHAMNTPSDENRSININGKDIEFNINTMTTEFDEYQDTLLIHLKNYIKENDFYVTDFGRVNYKGKYSNIRVTFDVNVVSGTVNFDDEYDADNLDFYFINKPNTWDSTVALSKELGIKPMDLVTLLMYTAYTQ